MPYPREYPHKILGIGRAFTPEELVKAMKKAARSRDTVTRSQTAFRELSDKKTRLEYELLMTDSSEDMEKELGRLMAVISEQPLLPAECPELPVPRVPEKSALHDPAEEFHEIVFAPVQLSPAAGDDYAGESTIPVIFDK